MPGKKKPQKLIVGTWISDPDRPGERVFRQHEDQPAEVITDMGAMIRWTKAFFKDSPGEYEFIREVHGALLCATQTSFDFVEELDRGDR
jgi:hypothetical protein